MTEADLINAILDCFNSRPEKTAVVVGYMDESGNMVRHSLSGVVREEGRLVLWLGEVNE